MSQLTIHRRLYRHTGLALLLLQLSVYIWTMPPFQTGIWLQTEPTVFVLYMLAAATGAWLLVGRISNWLKASYSHPLWLWLLAYAVWQLVCTWHALVPWRAWFGPPQTGDGTGLYISMLLTAAMAGELWQVRPYRKFLISAVALNITVQSVLHMLFPGTVDNTYVPDCWAPAQWPEYLPFMAGYLWVMCGAGGFLRTPKQMAALIAFIVAVVLVSCNRSAMVFFLPALFLIAITQLVTLPDAWRRTLIPNRQWTVAAMAACVLPLLMVAMSPLVPVRDKAQEPTGIMGALSNADGGLGSRLVLDRVVLSTIAHEPSRLVMGGGWGAFTDDLFKYALVDGVYSYHNGQHAPNWFLIEGTSHHSHNQPLEALLSLGLPGMLLWYAFPLAALWYLPRRYFWTCAPMIVALTALGHVWFQLPQCFPYQALYIVSLILIIPSPIKPQPKAAPLVMAAAVIAMGWSAAEQFSAMTFADKVHKALSTGAAADYNEHWLGDDLRHSGDRWFAAARYYVSTASLQSADKIEDDSRLGWYVYFMHNARDAAKDPSIQARASSLELLYDYYLFGGFNEPRFDALRHEATVGLEDAVMRMLHKAPERDDYETLFLLNLESYTKNDKPRQIKILERMLAIAPNHRGALWHLGHMLVATRGREAEGRRMTLKAVQLHVERVYPITDAQLRVATGLQ